MEASAAQRAIESELQTAMAKSTITKSATLQTTAEMTQQFESMQEMLVEKVKRNGGARRETPRPKAWASRPRPARNLPVFLLRMCAPAVLDCALVAYGRGPEGAAGFGGDTLRSSRAAKGRGNRRQRLRSLRAQGKALFRLSPVHKTALVLVCILKLDRTFFMKRLW